MDWKEGAKWVAVIAIGRVLTTVMEMVITRYVTLTASTVAHEEVERTLTAAVQQMQAQAASSRIKNLAQTQPQKSPMPDYVEVLCSLSVSVCFFLFYLF